MKKIVIGMLALSAFIFSAGAQENRKMKDHSRQHGQSMMLKGINLSEAQQQELKSSRENINMQMAELSKDENITVKEYKARKAAILKSQKEQMEKVLTPEQKKQLEQNKQNRKARHDQFSAKKMDKMKADLNLTDEQVSKLELNRSNAKVKARAITDNSQLSPEEKKAQLKALRLEQKNSFRQVLTPEQVTKMQEKRKEKPRRSKQK